MDKKLISFLVLLLCTCTNITLNAQPCTEANPAACVCPTPGATDCYLLPDITAGKGSLNQYAGWMEFSQTIPGDNKGLIRLDVSTPNIGAGPMEIYPTNNYICGLDTLWNYPGSIGTTCPDGSEPKILIKQKIYHKIGNTFQIESHDAGWMQYHPQHGHIHIDDWGRYTLRMKDPTIADTLQWPIVSSSIKVSYCLIDLTTCSGSPGDCRDDNGNFLNNQDFPNFNLGGPYFSCGFARQGISSGHVDIYHQSIPQSYVRVPYEACNGEYFIIIKIDPDNHILEMNDNNNWLAAKVNLTQQNPAASTPYSYIFSEKGNTICPGETMKLEAAGASKYVWSTGETTQAININSPGKYWVESTTPCGTITSDTLEIIASPTSSIPEQVRADTVCTGGSANLYASGNPHWFDAPTGGNLVFVGNNFNTGPIYTSKTFYVNDQPSTLTGRIGPASFDFSGDGNYLTMRNEYLIFNAFVPFKLKTVKVRANIPGNRTFELRDIHNDVLSSLTIFLDAGEHTVPLNFFVPAGLNHQLGMNSIASNYGSLYASTTTTPNIGYPFKIDGIAKIVGSSLGNQTYPFMYDWDIETTPQSCNLSGERAEVTATVTTAPTVTISGLAPVYLHTSSPVTITGTPPGGTFSGNGVVGNTFYPDRAGIGQHEIRYTYTMGQCGNTASWFVTVQFDSSTIFNGNTITVINNPSYNEQQLLVHSTENSRMEILLTNSLGQRIWKKTIPINNGTQYIPLDMNYLPKGIYFVQAVMLNGKLKKAIKVLK